MAIGNVYTIDGIRYVEVNSYHILNAWKCPNCVDSIVQVNPTFYCESGTPICGECEEDMVFEKSLIDISVLSSSFHK